MCSVLPPTSPVSQLNSMPAMPVIFAALHAARNSLHAAHVVVVGQGHACKADGSPAADKFSWGVGTVGMDGVDVEV